MATYTLDNCVEAQAEFPDTFALPPERDRQSLGRGDLAKLMFRISHGDQETVERMWVRVQEVAREGYAGTLDNDAFCTDAIGAGVRVEFSPEHVIQIRRDAS